MSNSTKDIFVEQAQHYAHRLSEEIDLDVDTALKQVLIMQARAYEDIEPACGIASAYEIFMFVEHQVKGAVEAMISKDHAKAYEQAFAKELDDS